VTLPETETIEFLIESSPTMKKIPTLFKRDFTQPKAPITPEYHQDVSWVLAGEGVATRKYDGTAALVRDGRLFKRYLLRPDKTAPPTFQAVEFDKETGKVVGWVRVGDSPDDKWFHKALEKYPLDTLADGTYELIGPKVNGNPEDTDLHELVAHADAERYTDVPTDFDGLREWLRERDIEGVVWHHPDGRMAKIKLKDYGLKRGKPPSEESSPSAARRGTG
jgi:Family of unknown function (DUF5565)